jgi:hypothetical protein
VGKVASAHLDVLVLIVALVAVVPRSVDSLLCDMVSSVLYVRVVSVLDMVI